MGHSELDSQDFIANCEKMRMEKSYLPITFAFPLHSFFGFPLQIFLELFPLPNFLEISFPPSKKGLVLGGGRELCVFI